MKTNPPKIVLCDIAETGMDNVQSYSPFCLKVHRALGTTLLNYEVRYGAPRDFRQLNPTGQVPVLLVDDEIVTDSTRIVARIVEIAAAHSRASLVPRDPRLGAEAWLWEDWADRALSGYLVAARWMEEENWPRVRDAYFRGAPWFVRTVIAPQLRRRVISALVARDFLRAGAEALWSDFRRILDFLEARAPRDGFWLTSERPTVADLGVFAQLQSLRTPLTIRERDEIARRSVLSDWLDRVDEATRPSRPTITPIASRHRDETCQP